MPMTPDHGLTPGTAVQDTDADEPTYLIVTRVLDERADEHIVEHDWKMTPKYLHDYDETNEQYPSDSPVVKAIYYDQIKKKETYSLEDDIERLRDGPFKEYPFPAPRLERL